MLKTVAHQQQQTVAKKQQRQWTLPMMAPACRLLGSSRVVQPQQRHVWVMVQATQAAVMMLQQRRWMPAVQLVAGRLVGVMQSQVCCACRWGHTPPMSDTLGVTVLPPC